MFSARAAHTVLPLASAAIVINGLQGTYLHLRGVAQRPGGITGYNLEAGPPVFAPLLASLVGGMGLLAAVLRREGTPPARHAAGAADAVPQPRPAGGHPAAPRPLSRLRRPGQRRRVGRRHRRVSCWPALRCPASWRSSPPPRSASPRRCWICCSPRTANRGSRCWPSSTQRLAAGETDGWHYDDLPEDGQAWRDTLRFLDAGRTAASSTGAASRTWSATSRPYSSKRAGPLADRRAGTAGRPTTCGACGPAMRAPRSTPTPGRGTRSASPGPAYPRGYLNPGIERPRTLGGRRRGDDSDTDPVPFAARVERARRRARTPARPGGNSGEERLPRASAPATIPPG